MQYLKIIFTFIFTLTFTTQEDDQTYRVTFQTFKESKVMTEEIDDLSIVSGKDETKDRRQEKLKNYNKNLRPFDRKGKTNSTKVQVNIFIENFGFINVQDMTFNIEMVLNQRWNDYRLKYEEDDRYMVYTDIKTQLWTPDLFFRNSKTAEANPVSFLWVYKNGDILYSQRMSMTLACIMRLEEFPMDSQKCYIELGSYGYVVEELEFFWEKDKLSGLSIELSERIFLNEFHRPKVDSDTCQSMTATGNFTCLNGEITFVRDFNFYLLYTYFPSALIIVICWLSFFVNYTVIAGRVSLCLFSLLSLLTQSASVITSLPPVSYVKAIDIWMFFCLALVVIALAEFCMINFFFVSRKKDKPVIAKEIIEEETANEEEKKNLNEGQHLDMELLKTESDTKKQSSLRSMPFKELFHRSAGDWEEVGHDIDKLFRVIFPAAFVAFNFVYWTYYYANESASLKISD